MGPKPFRYMRADVMPLFAAVAVGIGAAGTIITRKLFADPSVTTWRSMRGHEVQPEEGEQYRDSALRRFAHGRKIEMFPFNLGNSKSESSREHA
ncbi:g10483 [Coccomyxa viridis]|uniref:G10483 protein n=1 Tax=Coccomyxa viridis TaxID=1274662 RepID=A0ABP1GAA9_9CHLO